MVKASIYYTKPFSSLRLRTRQSGSTRGGRATSPTRGADAETHARPRVSALAQAASHPLACARAVFLSLVGRRVGRLLARCKRSSASVRASLGDEWVFLPVPLSHDVDDTDMDDELTKDGFIVYKPFNTSAESLNASDESEHEQSLHKHDVPLCVSQSHSSGNLAAIAAATCSMTISPFEHTASRYSMEHRCIGRASGVRTLGDLSSISEAGEVQSDTFSRAWTSIELARLRRLHYINSGSRGRQLKPFQLLIA